MSTSPGGEEATDVFAAKDRLLGIGLVRDPHPKLRELREPVPGARRLDLGHLRRGRSRQLPDTRRRAGVGVPLRARRPHLPRLRRRSRARTTCRRCARSSAARSSRWIRPTTSATARCSRARSPRRRWCAGSATSFAAIVETIDKLALRPLGRGDLATDFAFHYPITVTAVAAGLPVEDVPTVLRAGRTAHERRRRRPSVVWPPAPTSPRWCSAVVDDATSEPRDDLISILVAAEITDPDGARAAPHRRRDRRLPPAARAGGRADHLPDADQPALRAADPSRSVRRARARPSLIPRAVEEGLRWEPPLLFFGRIATVDTEIEGRPVPAGKTVNVCVHSANRDPDRWDNPDEFDIFRQLHGHLAFGQGNHICLGIHFARMELRVALELIIERLPNLRLDPDATTSTSTVSSRARLCTCRACGTSTRSNPHDRRPADQGRTHLRRHGAARVHRRRRGARRPHHARRTAPRRIGVECH